MWRHQSWQCGLCLFQHLFTHSHMHRHIRTEVRGSVGNRAASRQCSRLWLGRSGLSGGALKQGWGPEKKPGSTFFATLPLLSSEVAASTPGGPECFWLLPHPAKGSLHILPSATAGTDGLRASQIPVAVSGSQGWGWHMTSPHAQCAGHLPSQSQ